MPTKIDLEVQSVTIQSGEDQQGEYQSVTTVLIYRGATNLTGQIEQGEELTIEIPSHAPPPAPKKGK